MSRTTVVFAIGWLAAAIPASLLIGALFARRASRPQLPVVSWVDGSSGADIPPLSAPEQSRERPVECSWCGRRTWTSGGVCQSFNCREAEGRWQEKQRHPTAVEK